MKLKNMKQKEIERVEVYYEQIQKLAHGFLVPTTNNFLIIVFRAGLWMCYNDYKPATHYYGGHCRCECGGC
jgi:hypothetical protein